MLLGRPRFVPTLTKSHRGLAGRATGRDKPQRRAHRALASTGSSARSRPRHSSTTRFMVSSSSCPHPAQASTAPTANSSMASVSFSSSARACGKLAVTRHHTPDAAANQDLGQRRHHVRSPPRLHPSGRTGGASCAPDEGAPGSRGRRRDHGHAGDNLQRAPWGNLTGFAVTAAPFRRTGRAAPYPAHDWHAKDNPHFASLTRQAKISACQRNSPRWKAQPQKIDEERGFTAFLWA